MVCDARWKASLSGATQIPQCRNAEGDLLLSRLFRDAFHVIARLGVHENVVAFVDEDWDADHETVVDFGVLQHIAASGISLRCGFGLRDGVLNLEGKFDGDGFVAVHDDGDVQAFLEELDVVAHHVVADHDLIEGLTVHTGDGVCIAVNELHFAVVHGFKGQRFRRLEVVFYHFSRCQGLNPRANERTSFSWRHALETGYDPEVAVHVDDGSFLDVVW